MSNLKFAKLVTSLLIMSFVFLGCSESHSIPATALQETPTAIKIPIAITPTPYTTILICSDCAAVGMKINVWETAGTSRGKVSFSVSHNTTVNVIDSKIADDGRRWYKVEQKNKNGWIPQDFVRQ